MMSDKGKVSILMGTYNGEKYLEKQLRSIASQTYTNWTLVVSDDGSTDDTCKIIERFAKEFAEGKVILLQGPRKGFASNFFSLLNRKDIITSYYAFCDQDDIWCDNKIENAIKQLTLINPSPDSYCLYGSRTTLIDAEENVIGCSPCFRKSFNFNNALLQSYAGGNTMVFSRGLKRLFEQLPSNLQIVSHDWILYIICSAMNGDVIYDIEPKILYRQHDQNLVGSNLGFKSKLTRFNRLFAGEFKSWSQINAVALECIKEVMPEENRRNYERFSALNSNLLTRVAHFIHGGFYRQNGLETCAFFIMNLFRKLG